MTAQNAGVQTSQLPDAPVREPQNLAAKWLRRDNTSPDAAEHKIRRAAILFNEQNFGYCVDKDKLAQMRALLRWAWGEGPHPLRGNGTSGRKGVKPPYKMRGLHTRSPLN